ncbi:hypothetical protein [Nostoc sp.]|uniref:hypothetical protein n=1 Tax=Nostoc sp. TaxID=1180 RepID=UPI002FF86DAE
MNRPQNQKQITSSSSWWRRLTATLLLGSFLHSTIPISAIAQQTNNPVASLPLINQATYTYTDSTSNYKYQGSSSQINVTPNPLLDPLGRILGCAGTILPDYTGFSVGVYEPNSSDPTGTELGSLVALTRTELPDIPNNNIPGGKSPNTENSNPYFVTNNPAGVYNFLLDPNKGQTDPGRTYIFVVNPPPNSIYKQRRVKIEILASSGTQGNDVVRYVATSLDGQPISLTGETRVEQTIVLVPNAEVVGLDLLAFEFTTNLCQANQLQIIKTGDRAAAEPGDTVIYRLSIKNLADGGLNNIFVTDNLPLGFQFLPKSVQGELDGQPVTITSERNGNTVTFRTDVTIPTEKILNIAYAAQLTADALRGNGRNSAIVNAQRADNRFSTKDGPATHQLKIRPGIVSDCGTIIGRVFVDKNFDGEQQRGEPGVPNAVIFLEDGNRITTDPNGLFSLANALPGYHTGVLDLSSVPGYTLAHNEKFRERNSQSRLVHLEPGGLVRMNFAVTPTFQEPVKK